MASDLSNYIKVSIPKSCLSRNSVRDALQRVTGFAGGVTSHDGEGSWVDASGFLVTEKVRVFQWNYRTSDHFRVDEASRRLLDALFNAGEQAVLKERFYRDNPGASFTPGYVARMIYAPAKAMMALPAPNLAPLI